MEVLRRKICNTLACVLACLIVCSLRWTLTISSVAGSQSRQQQHQVDNKNKIITPERDVDPYFYREHWHPGRKK